MNRTRSLTPAAALLLLASSAFAADGTVTGTFQGEERYQAPLASSPATASRAYVQTVPLANGKAVVDVRATAGSKLIIWTLPVSGAARQNRAAKVGVGTALRTPSGRVVRGGESDENIVRMAMDSPDLGLDLPGAQEAVHVKTAEAGTYQVEVNASGEVDAAVVIAAEPASALTLEGWVTPLSRQPGQPLTLSARLLDGGKGVAGAKVTARLAAPGKPARLSVDLFDDGRHQDGRAGDGIYGAVDNRISAEAGFWSVRFDAEGAAGNGLAFGRTASTGFMNERGAARFAKGLSAVVVGEGEGRVLRVSGTATVKDAGNYRFDAIVAGAAEEKDGSRAGVAWGERSQRLAAGKASLSIDVPLPAAAQGPFFVDVRLLALDSAGLADRTTLQTR